MDRPRSDPEDKDEFARMMEESLAPKFHQEGETVQGTIVAIGPDVAFVDVGGKGEATIDVVELADPDSDVKVKVGDTVQAAGDSPAGGLKLSPRLAPGAGTRETLNAALPGRVPAGGEGGHA